jgi:flagellar motor switch protein FliN
MKEARTKAMPETNERFLERTFAEALTKTLSDVCRLEWQATVTENADPQQLAPETASFFKFDFAGALIGKVFLQVPTAKLADLGLKELAKDTITAEEKHAVGLLTALRTCATTWSEMLSEHGTVDVQVSPDEQASSVGEGAVELLLQAPDSDTQVSMLFSMDRPMAQALEESFERITAVKEAEAKAVKEAEEAAAKEAEEAAAKEAEAEAAKEAERLAEKEAEEAAVREAEEAAAKEAEEAAAELAASEAAREAEEAAAREAEAAAAEEAEKAAKQEPVMEEDPVVQEEAQPEVEPLAYKRPSGSGKTFVQEEREPQEEPANLDLVLDVELNVTLRFGQRQLPLRDVLELTSGAVVELDRQVDEPVELVLDGKVIARGEAVIIDGNYGLRVTQVLQTMVA